MARKRILCIFDGEEQVVFGTIRFEPDRRPCSIDGAIAVIHDEECPESPIRISDSAVLEVADAVVA